jgi:hypothetical protein
MSHLLNPRRRVGIKHTWVNKIRSRERIHRGAHRNRIQGCGDGYPSHVDARTVSVPHGVCRMGPLPLRAIAHRQILVRAENRRLDPRLSARLDASDVVQETFAEAVKKLPQYLRRRPLPFYPGLRQVARQRMV